MSPPNSHREPSPWWLSLLQRQGLPTFLVLAACYLLTFHAAPYIGHKLDTLVNWHMQNYDKITASLEEQTQTNRMQAEAVSLHTKQQQEVLEQQKRLVLVLEEKERSQAEQLPVLEEINKGIKGLGSKIDELAPKPVSAPNGG